MKRNLILMVVAFLGTLGFIASAMDLRGVVYDVGLQYNPGQYSVEKYDADAVAYDMQVIASTLRANAVRIEGEDIDRLVSAAQAASNAGLKVYFNPWLMGGDETAVVKYMGEAAKAAEKLRRKGMDIVFVAGCEYSLFCDGVFDGSNVSERIASLTAAGTAQDAGAQMAEKNVKLNAILANIAKAVRENYKGQMTYAAGIWEDVDWSLFDIVGIDYYRHTQSEADYRKGIKEYKKYKKPVVVMEVGCCAYEGAAQRGGGGFTICQGCTPDGQGIYEGGITPTRSEQEQADYIEQQIKLLNDAGVKGAFAFVFAFPIMPFRENGFDADMTSYALVKSFPADDPRSQNTPRWEPKEAFFSVADSFRKLER